jgi:SAM-dependent methyltransferase
MKNNLFEEIKTMYSESYQNFGDSPASLMTPKGRQSLRFRALDSLLLSKEKVKILDYGCGLGYLYQYLLDKGANVEYSGVDITPAFVDACTLKFPKGPTFKLIEPDSILDERYDIVFASGVFNYKTNENETISKKYAYDRIKSLFDISSTALVCDFLSPFVDFKQDQAQHFTFEEIANFCACNLTRRFVLSHDLLPYEFTLLAYSDDRISRPENIYYVDEIR